MRLFNQFKNRLLSIKEKLFLSFILFQSLLISQSAMAQTGQNAANGLFPVPAGDLSVQMLSKLFGGLINGGGDPLLDLITTFNGCVLAIGGVLVAYTIFAGTIGTAHEGEMLGKKFSSVWVPIRTAMGTALVIPINGYCGMQMLVMWLVLQGIGLADNVWTSLVKGDALMTGTITATAFHSPEVNQLANNMLKASICIRAQELNKDITGRGDVWSKYSSGSDSIFYGVSGSTFAKSACGEVNLIKETVQVAKPNSANFAGVAEMIGTTPDTLPITKAHNDAAKEMADSLLSAATSFVSIKGENGSKYLESNVSGFSKSAISTAVQAYQTKVTTAVQTYYSSQDKDGESIKKTAAEEGWIMAGAWFIKLSSQMTKANNALAGVPKSRATSSLNGYENDEVNKILASVNTMLAEDALNKKSGLAKQNARDGSGNDDSLTATFAKMLGETMTGIEIDKIAEKTNIHPIMQLKQMGDQMVTRATQFMFGLIGVWSIAAGTMSLATGHGIGKLLGGDTTAITVIISAALFISPIAFTIFGSLITLGFFLGYYIPMIPFLIWLGCLIGWFIMVMEAIIAAPLWAVMHLHPNGDDLTGKGGSGYMLVLGLLVRPTLMIFGFGCALVLSMVFGQFINSIFYDVFRMSRTGDAIGFFGVILAYILYTTMMITFMHKMFSVIHVIPDQLLRWIGGGGEQLGQYAGALVQGTEGQFMKGGAAMGALGNQALQAGLGASQRKLQAKAQQDGNEADAARNAGMTPDIAKDISAKDKANGGEGLGVTKTANAMNEMRQMLQTGGASASDLAASTQAVTDGVNSGKTLPEAIKSAKSEFYDRNYGEGASKMMNQISNNGQDKSAESRAAGTLAKAQSSFAAAGDRAGMGNYMSDLQSAINSGGVTGSEGGQPTFANEATSFSNPAVASAVATYQSSHGTRFDSSFKNGQPTGDTYKTAMNAVNSAYGFGGLSLPTAKPVDPVAPAEDTGSNSDNDK